MSKCKMCDTSRYTKVEVAPGRYRLRLLDDTIDISCNLDEDDFKIGNYTIQKCPICGRLLFKNFSGSNSSRRFRMLDDKGREVGYIMFNQYPGVSWVKVD